MSVFHWGELQAQAEAGLSARASAVSRLVQPVLPDGAGDFLGRQHLLAVGAPDDDGRLWASLFTGPPGFVTAVADDSVRVLARLAADDPVAPMTRRAGRLGLLAIELRTRIRLRMNGAATPLPDGLRLTVEQSFPNCARHIQRRGVVAASGRTGTETAVLAGALDETMSRLIARADTFFVASASEDGDPDVSHRGGDPGFTEVLSPGRLRWPDYSGNGMLMTLGNIIENSHAGLLFVDWATGSALQLTGRARVLRSAGSRSVEFDVDEAVHRPRALPMTWSTVA
ncbi:MAG TPA: pyridoxamine 5'-phosphate oxidase family protein [Actinoplanes sp.]|nr:pyridoxamine 5'-phosphate oxidase family protein [Actinoplanes sp.]